MADFFAKNRTSAGEGFPDENFGKGPLNQTWGITGQRLRWYRRDTLFILAFGPPFGLAFWAWNSTKTGTEPHRLLLVLVFVTGAIFAAYHVYRILHGWTTPQLRWKEFKAAKQNSEQNLNDLENFAENIEKRNDSHN